MNFKGENRCGLLVEVYWEHWGGFLKQLFFFGWRKSAEKKGAKLENGIARAMLCLPFDVCECVR